MSVGERGRECGSERDGMRESMSVCGSEGVDGGRERHRVCGSEGEGKSKRKETNLNHTK